MKQRTLLIVAIALIAVGILGVIGTSLVSQAVEPQSSSRRARGTGGTDAMFIEQMVPHHQDAIDMAELALERAEHPELRELAQTIADTQSAENEQMRSWYREWYGGDVPDVGSRGWMMGPMMGDTGDLEDLREAEDFDREFIEQMVPHHQMAIMMARMASGSRRPEMRQLTDSIVETQSREIEMMRDWYREWYGRR